uniref:MARVEL domain-containing protein n=1 Tax=Elaeophora elaphi TaxID=1147741 RepID=A0A0R3RU80_9BILA
MKYDKGSRKEKYDSGLPHFYRRSGKTLIEDDFLFQGLAVLMLLSLASAHSVPANSLLWLIAVAVLSGSIFSQVAHHLPSLLAKQMNHLYIYDLTMTICTSVCVPLSTYCTAYHVESDNSSTLYIALALLCIFLATSFLFSLLIRYGFDPFGKRSTIVETLKPDECCPLLPSYIGYANYQWMQKTAGDYLQIDAALVALFSLYFSRRVALNFKL